MKVFALVVAVGAPLVCHLAAAAGSLKDPRTVFVDGTKGHDSPSCGSGPGTDACKSPAAAKLVVRGELRQQAALQACNPVNVVIAPGVYDSNNLNSPDPGAGAVDLPKIPLGGDRRVALGLGPVDSGRDAEQCRVTWQAQQDTAVAGTKNDPLSVVFSGGLQVKGWQPSSGPPSEHQSAWPAGLAVYEAPLPAGARFPLTLRVGDIPADLARHPNAPPSDDLDRNYAGQTARVTHSSYIEHAPPATTASVTMRASGPTPAFPSSLHPGDPVATFIWPTWSWVNFWGTGTVATVSGDGSEVRVDTECGICIVTNNTHQPGLTSRAIQPGNRIYLANSTALLDAPGEYVASGGKLYYALRAGEGAQELEAGAWVPAVDAVVALQGASNVSLQGIHFRDVSWHSRGFQEGFDESDSSEGSPSDAAVVLAGGSGAAVENCSFVGVGGGGVLLSEGAAGSTVRGSLFSHVGQSGVMSIGVNGTQSVGAQILGNTMDRIGVTLSSAGGVFLTTARDAVVQGNSISNTSRWGVAMRSNGAGALSRNVRILGNTIRRTGLHTRDYGGISTIDSSGGVNTGVLIEGNCVRDTIGTDTDATGLLHRPTWGWAVYLDNFSSNTVVRRNTVINSSFAGLFYHEGHNNSASNNIFAYNTQEKYQYMGSLHVVPPRKPGAARTEQVPRGEHPLGAPPSAAPMDNKFFGNIVYRPGTSKPDQYPPMAMLVQDGHVDPSPRAYLSPSRVINNVYFDPVYNMSSSTVAFDAWSFEHWQGMGFDRGSVVADPMFVDEAGNNWALRPGSPALQRGFDPSGMILQC